MQGHKGFIAGGCFKNILSREEVKDVDIFFHNQSDFDDNDDKWHWEYMLLYHRDFFEHLHQKRLVLDNKIPFPIST